MRGKVSSTGRDVVPSDRGGPDRSGRAVGVGHTGQNGSSEEGHAYPLGPRTVAEAAALLATLPPFSELSPVERARLAPALEEVTYTEGAVILEQGAPADALYIVREGQVQRLVNGVPLDTVRPPALFGELGLLRGEPRSSTMVAASRCVVWRLPADRFRRLLAGTPAVAARFAATVSSQLADSRRQVAALAAEVEALSALVSDEVHAERAEPVERDAARPPDVAEAARPSPATIEAVFAPPRATWWPSHATIGLVLAAVVLAGGWLLPPPAGLSVTGWHALATLIAVVPLLALDALPEGIVALLLAAVWVIGGVTTPAVAMSGFAASSWALVVAVLAVGGAIASTGLLYRLALGAVARTGHGFVGQALSLALAGLAIGPAIPNATARVTLFAPALAELAEALNYRAGSRAAAGLAMAVHSGFGQMTAAFLTSSTTAVLVYAVLPERSRESLNWVTWALRTAPTTLILFGILLAAVVIIYRPRREDTLGDGATRAGGRPFADHGLGRFDLQRALLGPPTRQEKVAGAVTLGMLAGFATQPLHGIDPGWIGVLALGVMAIFGVMNAEGLRAVNWSFALLFGILASMVNVFSAVKLDVWIAGLTAGTMATLTETPVLFVAVLTVISLGISLVLRWQAAAPLLTIALTPVAVGAGWDPWIVGLIAILACNAFFLPYQSTIYLALYHGTGGKLFTHAQARPMAFVYAVATLVALCASVPLWRAWGLM